jgi:hypothetical protein
MSELILITNWISTFITKKFALDGVALQIVNSFVIKILTSADRIFKNVNIEQYLSNSASLENIKYIFYRLIVLFGLCYMLYFGYKKFPKYMESRNQKTPEIKLVVSEPTNSEKTRTFYQIDATNVQSIIIAVNRFMQLHPEFFQTNINKRIINYNGAENFYIYDMPVMFDDKIHQTSGYFTTKYHETKTSTGIEKKFTLIFSIDSECKNTKCYTKLLEEYVEHELKHGNRVRLNYYKILNKQLITHTFYDKSINDWFTDVDKLKQEFFLSQAKYLFSIFDGKSKSSTNAWNNLIIHGKPGTGKSAFIYRLATQMKMNIISVDLSMFINKKKELYSMFHGQEFLLPIGNEKIDIGKNSIFVLEEFNGAIDNIMKIERVLQYKDQLTKNYFDKENRCLQQKLHQNEKEFGVEAKDGQKLDYMESASYSFSKKRKHDVDLGTISMELENIIKGITDDNQSDLLRMNDLLELFQGPIPIKDRIIIATTNHFQRIREYLPALFRPGRLTSLEFKYLDWETFCELCEYYFKEVPAVAFEITIPTSQLIEIAVKHKVMTGTLDKFISDILEITREVALTEQNKTSVVPNTNLETPKAAAGDQIDLVAQPEAERVVEAEAERVVEAEAERVVETEAAQDVVQVVDQETNIHINERPLFRDIDGSVLPPGRVKKNVWKDVETPVEHKNDIFESIKNDPRLPDTIKTELIDLASYTSDNGQTKRIYDKLIGRIVGGESSSVELTETELISSGDGRSGGVHDSAYNIVNHNAEELTTGKIPIFELNPDLPEHVKNDPESVSIYGDVHGLTAYMNSHIETDEQLSSSNSQWLNSRGFVHSELMQD